MQKPPSCRVLRCPRADSSRPARRALGLLAAISALLSVPAPAWAQFTITGENSINYAGTATNHAGTSYIGNYGTGTATLAGGATRNLEGSFILGYGADDNGTMNVTGAGTVWTFVGTRRTSYIGYTGAGALNINDSGRMNYTGGLSIGVYSAYSTTPATLMIASGGILTTTSAPGTSGISIGTLGGTNTASISVSGAGSLLSVGGGITFNANTSLTVGDGGQATFTKITLYGDAATTTTASILVSGAGSLVSAAGDLRAGTDTTGIGNLTVTDGGKLRVGGTFTMSRGTIKVGAGAAPGYLDTAAISGNHAGSPTIEFNHTSSNYSFTNDAGNGIALGGAMGVRVLAGTTLFTADSSYSGGTTITGGTLKILNVPGSAGASGIGNGSITVGAAGNLIIGNGGTSGTLSGASVITNDGQLTFNRSDAVNLQGVISGSGPITKLGAGDLSLSGNNASYTGTLTFSGSTLTLYNVNALGSAAGATLLAPGAALKLSVSGTIPEPITLSGSGPDGTGALIGAAATPILSGPLTLAGNTTVNVGWNGNLSIAGAIGESATSSGLTKIGLGTLTLANANTYAGGTAISAGTVNVQHSGALGAGIGSVTVASGTALQLQGNATVAGHDLTLNGVGYAAATGALRNLAGSNTWASNVTLASDSYLQTEAGSTLTVTGGLNGGHLELVKNGAGTLVLGGAGTFLGNVNLNAGTLTLDHSLALQSATLNLNDSTLSFGTLTAATLGGLTGFAPIALTNASAGGVTLTINSAVNSSYYSVLSGAGSLVKTGAATFSLSGDNTFTGTTLVSEGDLRIATSHALQYSPIALASTGTLTFGTYDVTIGGLSGTGNILLGNPSSVALTVNAAATSSYDGVLSGFGSLTKAGTGTLTLTGANTYTGATTVNAGTLRVNGSLAASAVTVNAGGTLSGSGSVGTLKLASGATLAPGNSPGTLFAGNTTFAAGSTFQLELNNAAGAAGTNWDVLAITGALRFNATVANPFLLDLTSLTALNAAGLAANFDPTADYSLTFLTTTTGIYGFDADAFSVVTSHFQNDFDGEWTISLTNSAHDLTLNYASVASAVPEPSTYAAIFGAVALGGAVWSRRRIKKSP